MFLLAVYPVLWIYKSPIVLSYGDWFLVLLSLFVIVTQKAVTAPKYLFLLWAYIALNLILLSHQYFKATYLIPGGVAFFSFAVVAWAYPRVFDLKLFRKYFKVFAVLSIAVFLLQEIQYFLTGYRFSALLPMGESMDAISITELIQEHHHDIRSSSLFREPSHFATYIITFLLLELFDGKRNGRFLPGMSAFAIIVLLLTRSGTAIIALVFALILKMFFYSKASKKNKVVLWGILMPLFAIVAYVWMQSQTGQGMISRYEEFSSVGGVSGYVRVIKGYMVYAVLPTINKIFGINQDVFMDIEASLDGAFFITGDKGGDVYMNGFTSILCWTGAVGMALYLLFYGAIFKKGDELGKSAVLMLLVISLVTDNYLSTTMIYLTLIAICSSKKMQIAK